MFVSEIYSDAKTVLGTTNDSVLFRRLTDAVRLANNQAKGNEWNVGQMDVSASNSTITLPADVETVLAVSHEGVPSILRDEWYQHHINGPGDRGWTPFAITEDLGPVCTFRDPVVPLAMYAVCDRSADTTKTVHIYGWDENGNRIYTVPAVGLPYDGYEISPTLTTGAAAGTAPKFAKIDRISKQETEGFVRLYGTDGESDPILLGKYQPWETTPAYRRIRVGDCSWMRIKYRKKDMEIRAQTDWININSREALLMLLRAVKYRLQDGQIDQAKVYEVEAMRLLSDQAESSRPPAVSAPQIVYADGPGPDEDRLFY